MQKKSRSPALVAPPLGNTWNRDSWTALPWGAVAYLAVVAAAAAAAATPFVAGLSGESDGWPLFVLLAGIAAVTNLFVARSAGSASYHVWLVFLVPAAILLPPQLVVLLAVAQQGLRRRRSSSPWFLRVFKLCSAVLATLAAWAGARAVWGAEALVADASARFALAGLAAAVVLVALNHLVLAPMPRLARRHSLRATGLVSFETVSTDFVLASLGVGIGALWAANPWLTGFALAPLVLVRRALAVPQLRAEARIEPKTGLFNARHFRRVLDHELDRARRFERPLALLMVDLDLLREVNNAHGHLAGDAVLRGIADVFREELRHHDVPARFGGEEFSILLPETPPEQAVEIAERIRRAVARRTFEVETAGERIRATVSIGIAGYPRDGADANALIHQADLAVYRAKLQGRNRVLDASHEPLAAPRAKRIEVAVASDHTAPSSRPAGPPSGGRLGRRTWSVAEPLAAAVAFGISYHAVGLYALAVLAVPVLLMRTTQAAYLVHARRTTARLREAAETIQMQNVSLERINELLRERSTAAMESLSATVDARDAYTAGHSRRVQQLALAIGAELGLSRAELDLLGHAALFHDIGKLTIPDTILLKPATLTSDEWALMRRHADEGAAIIDRLGFLGDAVPAIRHHHEHFDGSGYPDGLHGEEIPLGARIIHVADAFDSMVTTRVYRAERPVGDALDELQQYAGRQFCPRCVVALRAILPPGAVSAGQPVFELLSA